MRKLGTRAIWGQYFLCDGYIPKHSAQHHNSAWRVDWALETFEQIDPDRVRSVSTLFSERLFFLNKTFKLTSYGLNIKVIGFWC